MKWNRTIIVRKYFKELKAIIGKEKIKEYFRNKHNKNS
jgi:hypothetical protein